MRRDAARSAGPKLMPCMRGEAVAISSRFTTPWPVSRIAWTRIGLVDARLGLELGEQAVDVVDVPGALDLRDHHHVELVADLGDELRDVVEHPRRLERVDARPQLRVAEVHLAADADRGPRARPPCGRPGRRPRGCRAGCRPSARCRAPWRPSSRWRSRGSGSSARAGTGSRGAGSGASMARGLKKSRGLRMALEP